MRGLVVGLVAVAVVVAGCSNDEPKASPTPVPSSSAPASLDPSPTPSESVKPETAREFVARWANVEHQMLITGDTAAYLKLAANCEPCARLAGQIGGFYANGGWVKTTVWRVSRFERDGGSNQRPIFRVDTLSDPTRYRETKSGPVKRLEGGPAYLRIYLVKGPDGWSLENYHEVEP